MKAYDDNTRILYLIRGLPGAGKSTFANYICDKVVSADDYFTDSEGKYHFNEAQAHIAHRYCTKKTRTIMEHGQDVAVANVFVKGQDMRPYRKLAVEFDYKVIVIVVENRHKGKSIHNVPKEKMKSMRANFKVML